jgi:hypothetical protein
MAAKRHNMLNHVLPESVPFIVNWLHYFLTQGDNRVRIPREFDSHGDYLIHLLYPKTAIDHTAYTLQELTKLGDAALRLVKDIAQDVTDPVFSRVKGRTHEYVTDCFALLEVLPVSDPIAARDFLLSLRIDPRFDVKLDDEINVRDWIEKALNGHYL